MRVLRYIVFFVLLLILQVFFLQRMWSGLYISVYIGLLLMTDIQTPKWLILLIGFASGAIVDFLSAGAGLNAFVTCFVAACRYPIIQMTIPNAVLEYGGPLITANISLKHFILYIPIMLFIWSIMFFSIEAMFTDWLEILLRTTVNVVIGTFLLLILQLPVKN